MRLTGKAFAVLCHLVTHAGELVTKDELFQAVWPETVVSDAALASCIKELRQALRDKAREWRYIETVHRRGYRFLPAITATPPAVSNQLSVGKWRREIRGERLAPPPKPQAFGPKPQASWVVKPNLRDCTAAWPRH